MTKPAAIAVLEFDSIAIGALTADAMVKNAPIDTFRIGTVHPGKYLVLVGGSVAAIEEARRAAQMVGGANITDEIFLPDVHDQVYAAVEGARRDNVGDALGILETSQIPVIVAAADKAIKTAEVTIVEIRLGDGLGGKGIVVLSGLVHDVEVAMAAALEIAATHPDSTVWHAIIPIQHGDVRDRFASATRFFPNGSTTSDSADSEPHATGPGAHPQRKGPRRR
jgi:microcompartment protein CcmL/EutN